MKDFQDRYSPMFRNAAPAAACCPSPDSLSDLSAGRVWPWQRRRLIEHLSHCSDCADDYRALTMVRGGLMTALEEQSRAAGSGAAGWLRYGLAAAALVVMAVSVSVLIETGGPAPPSNNGVLFASEFEQAPSASVRRSTPDRLFASDFGEPEGEGSRLFRDDFGG